MKRIVLCLSLVALAVTLLPAQPVIAQEADGPMVWVITSEMIHPAEVDDCLALRDKYIGKVNEQLIEQGLLVKEKVLRHFYADQWNVVTVAVYKSWNDIDAAGRASGKIQTELFTEQEWAEFEEKVAGCSIVNHRDNIYMEHVPPSGEEMGEEEM